jgi:hypothetical protein
MNKNSPRRQADHQSKRTGSPAAGARLHRRRTPCCSALSPSATALPVRVLDALLVDVHDLKKRLERSIPRYSAYPPAENLFVGEFQVTTQVQRVLKVTSCRSQTDEKRRSFPEHLMLSLLKHTRIPSRPNF